MLLYQCCEWMVCVILLLMLVGPTFGAVYYISGTRQGQTVLYRENSYPFYALGDVSFLWRPLSTVSSESDCRGALRRQLWIWTHPASYADIFAELKKVFNLSEADCKSIPVCSGSSVHYSDKETTSEMRKRKKRKKKMENGSGTKRLKLREDGAVDVTAAPQDTSEHSVINQDTAISRSKSVEQFTDATKSASVAMSVSDVNTESKDNAVKDGSSIKSRTAVQCGEPHLRSKTELVRCVYENCEVRLESLKDELCRFRLVGPKSHQVIVEAVCLAESSSVRACENHVDDTEKRWWDDYIVTEHGSVETMQQANSWKKVAQLQNAAELPPFSVHGLIVRDPRLFLPQRRNLVSQSHSVCGE